MDRKIIFSLAIFAVLVGAFFLYDHFRRPSPPKPAGNSCGACSASHPVAQPAATPIATPAPSPKVAPQPAAAVPAQKTAEASAPEKPKTADTVPAFPPDGAKFVGSGRYQWYRQGNVTWRLNTETGSTCIIFATMAEWRKPIVASHGCAKEK